ncbi:MAG TPA: S9 family peptidase [Candidatus Limnocylindria bacterium]|nr:S9 family peptidase [Candidatus Limnocylindria bacterium]
MPELLPPLTPDDLASFAFVSDAQMSPDGTRVAYVVRRMSVESNEYRSAIWMVPADGSGEPVQFTNGVRQDVGPRWSPDGRWLAFLSDRASEKKEGRRPAKQLFIVPAQGGEARQLTAFADECSEPAWSPRGDALVVVVKDAEEGEKKEGAPRVYDRIRYKSDEGGHFDLRRKHLWIVCLDGTPPRRITDGDWDDSAPAFSPDGSRIAFVSNRSGERDRNTVADVWTVAFDGTGAARVTTEQGTYGNPSWSPDGARIGCYGIAEATGSAGRNVRMWSFPTGGGEGTDLLGEWDRTVGSVVMSDMRGQAQTIAPVWTPDGSRVHFVGTDQGTANAYSVSSAGGDLRAATLGMHQIVSLTYDRDVRRFAAIRATATEPGEVVAGEPGGALRPLTRANAAFVGSRWIAEPERVELEGAGGWRIEGWLMRPRGFDAARQWPLVLEIHGGPHAAYGNAFFHEFQVLAGRGYAVLYLNPRGSHGYGDHFVQACIGDWGGDDYLDLMAGVDHALTLGWVDPERLYVTGGSYGGFMTNWIVGHTDRFKAAVTQRSISNNVSAFGTSDIGWHFWECEHGATPWRDPEKLIERSPLTYVENVRTPLLILHAERDLRCPIEQAEQLFVALKVLGREAVFVRYQDDNHDLTRGGRPRNRIDHCRRIVDWFDAHP